MFAQLANQRFTDQATRKKIKRLAHRMDTGNRRRNDLIHGRWVAFGPKSSIIRFQQQPNIAKWRIIATSPSEIRGDAIKLIRTQLALRRFIAVIQKRNDRDRRASLRKNPDANLPSDTGSFVIVKLIENVLSDLNHLRCNLDFQIL